MAHIEQLDHRDVRVAGQIHAVLALAYAQEAEMLQVKEFTPLDRTIAQLQASNEYFFGTFLGEVLVAALSLGSDDEPDQVHVSTLVVHPDYQRQGLGSSLLREVLRRGEGLTFSVSTVAANAPALALYAGFGFVPYRRGSIGPESLPLVKLRRASAAP